VPVRPWAPSTGSHLSIFRVDMTQVCRDLSGTAADAEERNPNQDCSDMSGGSGSRRTMEFMPLRLRSPFWISGTGLRITSRSLSRSTTPGLGCDRHWSSQMFEPQRSMLSTTSRNTGLSPMSCPTFPIFWKFAPDHEHRDRVKVCSNRILPGFVNQSDYYL
jgi:hypothetical protein